MVASDSTQTQGSDIAIRIHELEEVVEGVLAAIAKLKQQLANLDPGSGGGDYLMRS
jgi:hypothetical protein